MNTSVRRIFTPAEKAIFHRVRQELRFWIADHRKNKAANPHTAFRVCMLHKALNRLKGRPDCHVIKKCTRGYHQPQVEAAVEYYLAAAQADVDQPLRCYVLVNAQHIKPDNTSPRASQLHVQAAHALCELMKGYGQHPDVTKWADVDQTLIICQQTRGLPRIDNIGYCPYGAFWPHTQFTDSHYGQTLAYAIYPMTERQAAVLGLTALPLL